VEALEQMEQALAEALDQQGLDPQTPVEAQDQLIHKIQEGDQGDIKSKMPRLRRLKRLSRNWRLLMSKTKIIQMYKRLLPTLESSLTSLSSQSHSSNSKKNVMMKR